METELQKRRTVTIPECSRVLGISPSHAYDLAREGRLPALRLGGRIVVLADELEKMLKG